MTGGPEHPERDPLLERAWRAQAQELPPPELDRAILAAAHRAAGSAPQDARARAAAKAEATRPQRWWMPLAAAATIGVVVIGILQVAPPDQEAMAPMEAIPPVPQTPTAKVMDSRAAQADSAASTAPGASREAAAPAPAEQQARTVPPAKETPAAPVPSPAVVQKREAATSDGAKEPEAKVQMPRAAPAAQMAAPPMAATPSPAAPPASSSSARSPEPFPAAAPAMEDAGGRRQAANEASAPARQEAAAVGRLASPEAPAEARARERDAAALRKDSRAAAAQSGERASTIGGAAAERAAPGAAIGSPEALRAKARDPQAWIARIRKLRDEGNVAEAQRELRDFRAAFTDAEARLPPDLRDWMKP